MKPLYVLFYIDETGNPISVMYTGRNPTPAVYDKLSSAKAIKTNINKRSKKKIEIFEVVSLKKILTNPKVCDIL